MKNIDSKICQLLTIQERILQLKPFFKEYIDSLFKENSLKKELIKLNPNLKFMDLSARETLLNLLEDIQRKRRK